MCGNVVCVTARRGIGQCCIVQPFSFGRSRRACCGLRNRRGMPLAGRGDGVAGAADYGFVDLCVHQWKLLIEKQPEL
jgi:hypothetical protein